MADPLGGSYLVEYPTKEIEDRAGKLLRGIEDMGGFAQAVRTGWVQMDMEKTAMEHQRGIKSGESTIVGLNRYVPPPEEDFIPGGVLYVSPATETEPP